MRHRAHARPPRHLRRPQHAPPPGRASERVQLAVLIDVAERAERGQPQLLELRLAALEPGLEPHDVAVGLVLRERQVEQVVRLFAGVRADEVGGHVVRRAERRVEVERAARRQRRHLIERHERDSTARRRGRGRRCHGGPARPVSWVYSPGVRNAWWSPVNFVSFSITTVRAGMLMPTASVSVANTTFTRPSMKHASTTSLNGGTMPA